MRIIEITSLYNGGHRNLTANIKTIPQGWAVIPDDLITENFPFGDVIAEEINGVMVVTSWTPGVLPEYEPESEPEPTTTDIINALLGVNE